MTPDLAKRWIDALRSGRYAQCREQLRDGDSFCCLGVAADLLWPAAWEGEWWRGENMFLDTQIGLTFEQAGWLSAMNDAGWTFAQIAADIPTVLQYPTPAGHFADCAGFVVFPTQCGFSFSMPAAEFYHDHRAYQWL